MSLATIARGQTSVVLRFKILNSSVSTGAGLTGLTHASSGLRISTIADNEAAATAYTVAGSTIETIATLGTYVAPSTNKCRFKEIDATNHPGWYELQLADARFAVSNSKTLGVTISGASNCAETDFIVELVADDPQVAKPTNFDGLSIDSGGQVFFGNSDIASESTLQSVLSVVTGFALPTLDANGNVYISSDAPNTGAIDWSNGSVNVTFVNNDIASESSLQSAITAIGNLVLPSVDIDGSVTFNNDISALALEGTLATVAGYIDTEVAAIKAKTDNLPASFPTNFTALGINASGYISRVVLTDTVTTLTGHTAQTGDAYAVVNSGTFGNSVIKTETAAIKAKTDNLPASPAAVGSAMTLSDGAITAEKIASDALAAAKLATDACQKIVDILFRRTMANVEGSANGEAISLNSLYGAVQQSQESLVVNTTQTIYKTDGTTVLGTKTITKTPGDAPIRGIS
jgi:hypothetical protein